MELLNAIIDKYKNYVMKKKMFNSIKNIQEGELGVKLTFMAEQEINDNIITIDAKYIDKNNLNLYIKDDKTDTLTALTRLMMNELNKNLNTKIQVYLITNTIRLVK